MHIQTLLIILVVLAAFFALRPKMYEGYGVYKYATLGNTNFLGGDIETITVNKVSECRDRCNQLDAVCKGFTVTRKKGSDGTYTCWPKLDQTLRPGNRTPDKTKTTYVRKDHWDYWKGQGLSADTFDSTGRGCFDKAVLYSDIDKQGSLAEYGCGVYPVTIGVSSIKVPRGLKVRVTGIQDGESFSSGWWTADVMNVGEGWNDKVKTVEVAAK